MPHYNPIPHRVIATAKCPPGRKKKTPVDIYPIYVLFHDICNGIEDCGQGNDEVFDCENLSIIPSVRCTQEHIFVDYKHVGDGYVQCNVSYDDELGQYITPNCSKHCDCSGFAIFCEYPIERRFHISAWTKVLKIHGQNNKSEANSKFTVPSDKFQFIENLTYLLLLEIMHTDISSIPTNAFIGLNHLTHLSLKANAIQHIAPGVFNNTLPK
jgi:hypothetical protein